MKGIERPQYFPLASVIGGWELGVSGVCVDVCVCWEGGQGVFYVPKSFSFLP